MIDAQALCHGLHRFTSTLKHQALEVVAAGGALVCAGQGGEDLGGEICEVIAGGGGVFRVHNLTLRPRNPTHQT